MKIKENDNNKDVIDNYDVKYIFRPATFCNDKLMKDIPMDFNKNFIDQYLNSISYVINEEIRTLRIIIFKNVWYSNTSV